MTVYSFQEIIFTFLHPLKGIYTINGSGVGNIDFSMLTDKTVQEVTADGKVISSFIPGDNGNTAMNIIQTSDFHKWLVDLYNLLKSSPKAYWNQSSIIVESISTYDTIVATGVCFTKLPDRSFDKQAKMITWNLLAESQQSSALSADVQAIAQGILNQVTGVTVNSIVGNLL